MSVDEARRSGEYRAETPGSDGGISEDISKTPVREEASPVTSDSSALRREQRSVFPTDKAENKVQQLIQQYGTEEGLRRLRESDPEAAQQFEQEPLRSDLAKRGPRSDRRNLRSSEPSPEAPDSEESEQ